MGVPKFFRWLSERYTKVNQRLGRVACADTVLEHYHALPAADHPILPDPLSTCSTAPPIDRLYIDMNGIIHGCSHNNNDAEDDSETAVVGIAEEEIFRNVCFYLDRIVKDICQPNSLVYMAIDGVAPRAKLNQQRSRRYRSGKEGLIEQTIYDAHLKQIKAEAEAAGGDGSTDGVGRLFFEESVDDDSDEDDDEKEDAVQEIEPGRFAGKFLAHLDCLDDDLFHGETVVTADGAAVPPDELQQLQQSPLQQQHVFHSNSITPGTPFFSRCTAHIQHFLQRKVSEDPAWQNLTIVFSGPNVPGEGEHKILQFMREQRCAYEQEQQQQQQQKQEGQTTTMDADAVDPADTNNPSSGGDGGVAYHPNLRHCIMGQDGDLIMLGLLTHEPNLVLLREQVSFDMKMKEKPASTAAALQSYVHNPNFELLHMNVLRDYFSYEFETSNVIPEDSPWCLEHCIDDFVFLTFFVGNDFLPHMPAVDIADEAFDLLFYTYRDQRKKWLKENDNAEEEGHQRIPYLTDRGNIVSGQRLEDFLQVLGKHETPYLEYKKSTDDTEKARLLEAKYGMNTIPSDDAKAAKEAADRAVFRERIVQNVNGENSSSSSSSTDVTIDEEAAMIDPDDEASSSSSFHYPGFRPVLTAASQPTKKKKSKKKREEDDEDEDAEALYERMGGLLRYSVKGGKDVHISEEDLKGRYYSDKFGFSPFDAEKHVALRKAYIEGLVWNLKYYYEGCVSWEWYYPYHYGPMLSDLVGIDAMLKEITFEGKMGNPLRPFEQLMACMPPSHADVLPEPYRAFMTDPESVIADFYPQSFTIDMNGKRWPWEAVVLLPFIDSKRLLETVRTVDESLLTEDERKRNEFGGVAVFSRDPASSCHIEAVGEGNIFGELKECYAKSTPFESTALHVPKSKERPVFKPRLLQGVQLPLPGFPTLRDGSVQGLWRKLLRVNVHGSKSRYKTACLEIENPIPEVLAAETLAEHLNGTLLWINYPHFVEAFVTAVSDSNGVIRGKSSRKAWSGEDLARRKRRVSRIVSNYVFGEKMVGTGGVALIGGEEAMEHLDILLYVRPFSGLKTLADGTVVKTFAKFEIEVPLFVTGWAPQRVDTRLANLPVRLEKDPYHAAKFVLTDSRSDDRQQPSMFTKTLGQLGESKYQPKKRVNEARAFHSQCLAAIPPTFNEVCQSTRCSILSRIATQNRAGFGSFVAAVGRTDSIVPGAFRVDNNTRGLATYTAAAKVRASSTITKPRHFRRLGISPKGRFLAVGMVAAISYFAGIDAVDFGSKTTGFNSATIRTPSSDNSRLSFAAESDINAEDSHSFPLTRRQTSPIEFAHGTTTLSFVFQGGIITAVDSRASLGSFVGSKTTQKVLPINSHVLGTMAGGAADCMYWIRKLRCEAALHELTEGRRMSVAQASRILSNALYENRGLGLSLGTMIMGFDDYENTDATPVPKIYYVNNSGMRIEGDIFAVGSGSILALGILDTERRYNMSVDEAVALGIKAIRHSTLRDAYSGGYVNVYLITARDGWTRVFTEDLDQIASGFEHSGRESA